MSADEAMEVRRALLALTATVARLAERLDRLEQQTARPVPSSERMRTAEDRRSRP